MKYRKIMAMALAAAMTVSLAACGGSKGADDTKKADTKEAVETEDTQEVEATLPFDGEYKETKLFKVGLPEGWVYEEETNTDEYVGVKLKSKETNDDETLMLAITMQQQANGGSYGFDTLKETALGELSENDRDSAEFSTVEVGGYTFAKIEYTSSILDAKRMVYVYSTDNIEYPDAGSTHCKYELVNSISGPYEDSRELIEQISESIILTLPDAYKDADPMPLEDEATDSGKVDITGGTIEAPEGWKLENSAEKSAKYSNPDIHGSTVEFNYSTMTKSAEEWAHDLDGNFGGGNAIDQVTLGDNTYWHLSPVEGQHYLTLDGSEEKTVIKISTMNISLEEATPLIETFKLK